MHRALVHAYELAGTGTADSAALGVVRAALSADSAVGVGMRPTDVPSRGDTLRAYLHEKEGFLRWRLGDRAGSLRAYAAVWSLPRVPLPDSLAAETVRAAAYVAVDSTLGGPGAPPLTRADTLGAIRLLDKAVVWARATGQNAVASRALDCLSVLLATYDGDASVQTQAAPTGTPNEERVLWGLLVAAVLAWGLWHYVQHRWYREDLESTMRRLGVPEAEWGAEDA